MWGFNVGQDPSWRFEPVRTGPDLRKPIGSFCDTVRHESVRFGLWVAILASTSAEKHTVATLTVVEAAN